ncbi:MAG: hypothetical protein ACYC44_03160 [Patescibacteria group bacterium]
MIMAGIVLGLVLATYLLVFNYVEAFRVGIAWNYFNGQLTLQQPGMYITPPWVTVAQVDTRPQRVCITSAGRGYNCKLVQFEPSAYREFVAVEGHRYYWMANRFSFNCGYDEEYRGMRDILRGHAFGSMQYPFLRVIRDVDLPHQ